jgi:hypothetical protein
MRSPTAWVVLVALLLTGCSPDILDVNRRALVYVVAVDYLAKSHEYAVGFLYANPGAASSQQPSSGGLNPQAVGGAHLVETGRTVDEAIDTLENELPSQAFFGTTQYVVLGESLLRHGASAAIISVARLRQLPLRIDVLANPNGAISFLSNPALAQRPLYGLFDARARQDIALAPEFLYVLLGHTASPELATLVPMLDLSGQHLNFEGDSVVAAGRERAALSPDAAVLVQPLVAAGPADYAVDIPTWRDNPLLLAARQAEAHVTVQADGTVLVHEEIRGYMEERGPLEEAGYSERSIAAQIDQQLASRLLTVLLELRRHGVDPRSLTGQTWSAGSPLRLKVEVAVFLDRETGAVTIV